MKLSIVTSTYNNEKELVLLYDSILTQKEYVYEWIICDDGSTDNTWEAIKLYSKLSPFPIEGLQQTKRGARYATNLNNGFKKTTGDVIFSVNGDSYLNSNALKEIHATFIPMSVGSALRINLDNEGNFMSYDWRVPKGGDEIIRIDKEQYPYACLTGNGMIIDPRIFKKVGYWNEQYQGYGKDDWEFFLRIQKTKLPMFQYNNVKIFQEQEEDFKEDTPENMIRFEEERNAHRSI